MLSECVWSRSSPSNFLVTCMLWWLNLYCQRRGRRRRKHYWLELMFEIRWQDSRRKHVYKLKKKKTNQLASFGVQSCSYVGLGLGLGSCTQLVLYHNRPCSLENFPESCLVTRVQLHGTKHTCMDVSDVKQVCKSMLLVLSMKKDLGDKDLGSGHQVSSCAIQAWVWSDGMHCNFLLCPSHK